MLKVELRKYSFQAMESDKFQRTPYRNPPQPPILSKQLGREIKTEPDSGSDSETVVVPRASPHKNLEKLKAETLQLRSQLFNLENKVVPSKTQEVNQLQEKLSNLENVVIPRKNQEVEQLQSKLISLKAENDTASSDTNLAEEEFVEMVYKLMEAEEALNVVKEEKDSLSSSLKATLCDLEKGHRLEMEVLETKVLEKDLNLVEETTVTSDLKLQLERSVEIYRAEVELAENDYGMKIVALQTKLHKTNGQLEKCKKVSKQKLEKLEEDHKTEISSVKQQFDVEIEALKAKLLEKDELLATLTKIKLEKKTEDRRKESSSSAASLNEKEMQLAKAKEENERLTIENSQIEAMLTQAQEDLKNSNEAKAAIQEKSPNKVLELTAVKLEHQKDIHELKFRLEEFETGKYRSDAVSQMINPAGKHVQNFSDTDDDIEILEIGQPVKTSHVAPESNVEQSPVRNRAKRSSIKRGPEYHGIYACYKFRCICGSTFPSEEPLRRHLQENGVDAGVVSSSKSSKRGQDSGENFSERANVQHKKNRGFEDRP